MNEPEIYSIDVENQEIVIRLNSELVDRDALTRLLDYIEIESIRKRSRLTQAEASDLTDEVNREVWDSTKHKCMEK